jgi:hypothetical protein
MTSPTTSNHNTATAANTTTTPIRALHQLTLICDFGQNMQLPRLQHEGQLFNWNWNHRGSIDGKHRQRNNKPFAAVSSTFS